MALLMAAAAALLAAPAVQTVADSAQLQLVGEAWDHTRELGDRDLRLNYPDDAAVAPTVGLPRQPAGYQVTLVERSSTPVISAGNPPGHGNCPTRADGAPCQCFNPSYIPASAHKLNQSGVLLRVCCGAKPCDYLCSRNDPKIPAASCVTLTEGAKDDEFIGFAPCDLKTGVCGDVLPRSTFDLDPTQGTTQDPRAFLYEGSYYSFYWTADHGSKPCDPTRPPNMCSVGLSKSDSPLTQGSWKVIGRMPWYRNACCIMKPRGQKSYCIWGFGMLGNEQYLPGLGISYTTDIDSGQFTQVPWKVAPGVLSPLGNNSMAFLPLGPDYHELGLEASARPVPLSNGHWLHFYASHTCGFGWNPRPSAACGGPHGNYTGNYTVGWIVLNGSDPTQILERWNEKTPWMNPVHDYETLCNADLSGKCKWKGATPWTLFLPSADPIPGEKDTFRVFWGAGDGNTGTGVVRVTVPQDKRETVQESTQSSRGPPSEY